MEFRKSLSRRILVPLILLILIAGVILCKFLSKANSSNPENIAVMSSSQDETSKEISIKAAVQDSPESNMFKQEDAVIQQQLDRDREEQKQTKYLKTKLEQTHLELEQEKALAEINKLKMENTGGFSDSTSEGQKNLPEIKVEYIGGDSVKKEAILSIAGTSFQVKEKTNPTDNIQVVSISDSSVTLHFSSPVELTKTIDYKPE